MIGIMKLFIVMLFRITISQNVEEFYELSAKDINGKEVSFASLSGKVVLIVNVASQCGYTDGHYRGLRRLYDILNFSNKLEILAFPCNQFGSQEPGSNEEIKKTVFDHYKARFRLMDKVDVHGAAAHPVWQYLTSNSKVVPQWNFYKYLIDNHGNIVNVWPPQTSVEDIYDEVEKHVYEADQEVQMESPLGDHHDEL